MKKFKITYTFEGDGVANIEAKNKKEAKEMFFNGDIREEQETEQSTNYEISDIQEIK